MGVPSLCVAPEAPDMRLSPLGTRQRFHVREGGSDNVPGASSCLSRPEAYDTKSSARALDLVEMETGRR